MPHVKKELLEHLIRECVKEVVEQASEGSLPVKFKKEKSFKVPVKKGAVAPPEDGQGTADQPAIPKKPTFTETKLTKEWINTKDGKPMSEELNQLKMAIKNIVREVFSE